MPRRVIKYEIITAKDSGSLSAKIGTLLYDGFQPYGDPFFLLLHGANEDKWAQAVVLTEYFNDRRS
jgi:hypothetical protein